MRVLIKDENIKGSTKMFNTYVTRNEYPTKEIKGSTNVNVTEKRASTDESLKLLSEMQQQIRDSLISVDIENNDIKFLWWVCDEPSFCRLAIMYKIIINNDEYQDVIKFQYFEEIPKPLELRKLVVKKISETIANRYFEENMASVVSLYQRLEKKGIK